MGEKEKENYSLKVLGRFTGCLLCVLEEIPSRRKGKELEPRFPASVIPSYHPGKRSPISGFLRRAALWGRIRPIGGTFRERDPGTEPSD